MNNYDDIINLNRPISKHQHLGIDSRSAQFAPFAALVGYDEAVKETARLTDKRIEIDEGLKEMINSKLNYLNDKYKQYNGIAAGETVIYQKLKKNYLIALNKGIEQTEIEIEKKQKEVDYRREQLKVRQIERKTVDILREKRKNFYEKVGFKK